MNENKNFENIDKLSLFTKKYTELISLVIENLSKIDREKDYLGFCNYILLQRFYYNSLAIRSLLPLLKKDLYYKIPIGLIIRTCISDSLTYFYFIYLAKTIHDEAEFNTELKSFLAESLHYLEKNLDVERKSGKLSSEQFQLLRNSFLAGYKDFFQKGSETLLPQKRLDFKKIANLLKSNPELKWTAEAYDFYDYLSKYEHFGVLTFDIQAVHLTRPFYDIKGYIVCIGHVYEAIISIMKSYKFDIKYKRRISFINKILFIPIKRKKSNLQ